MRDIRFDCYNITSSEYKEYHVQYCFPLQRWEATNNIDDSGISAITLGELIAEICNENPDVILWDTDANCGVNHGNNIDSEWVNRNHLTESELL